MALSSHGLYRGTSDTSLAMADLDGIRTVQ